MGIYMLYIIFGVILENINLTSGYYKPYCWDFRGSVLDRGTKCGYSNSETVAPRIMHGVDAELGESPWMARLYYKRPGKNTANALCGGSIIHESFILTAAHCCNTNLTIVRLGEYDTKSPIDCNKGKCAPKPVDVKIEYFRNHPKYVKKSKDHLDDICLIKLAKPLNFTDYVFPICLPLYPDKHITGFGNDSTFEVMGWGKLDEKTKPQIMQKLSLRKPPLDVCQEFWRNHTLKHAKQVCAGSEVAKDVCSGDSGGPLMILSKDKGPQRYFQVGLVSYGMGCLLNTTTITPGLYTRVSHYLPWIISNMY